LEDVLLYKKYERDIIVVLGFYMIEFGITVFITRNNKEGRSPEVKKAPGELAEYVGVVLR